MSLDPVARISEPAPSFLLVVSGPSGVGKNAVCERLIASDPRLVRSVSATTRGPRAGEVDGRDYHFWAEARFREEIARGRFLEWAEVHGHLYGTPVLPIENELARGRSPVLNIDVQGGSAVKALIPAAVLVFLLPPSLPALGERLRKRGTDDEEEIRRRLVVAMQELARWEEYDYALVNDDLDRAVAGLRTVVEAERFRVSRLVGGYARP